jgi:hypothetical protein
MPTFGPPRDDRHQLVEQRVRIRQPAGAQLDPRAVAELAAFGVVEQRALDSQLHDRECIAQAFEG